MQGRVTRTFYGYFVVIAIPLTVLLIQGISALRTRRLQAEENIRTKLENVNAQFNQDLRHQWVVFMERERTRSLYQYQPVMIPEEARFFSPGRALQLSPLRATISSLDNLVGEPGQSDVPTEELSGQLGQMFDNSLIGYFEFDPITRQIITPYDPTDNFSISRRYQTKVQRFHRFLEYNLVPNLVQRMNLVQSSEPPSILLHLKSKLITRKREPLERMREFESMSPETPSHLTKGSEWVNVTYYDFHFETVRSDSGGFVFAFRPVRIQNHIKIQGFAFNLLRLLQEAQSYLEPVQPEFGDVIVSVFDAHEERQQLFKPFTALSVRHSINDEERHLDSYYAERKRFWFAIGALFIALVVSLMHMARLFQAEKQLTTKKNDFISAVTHELKAPLTSIRMYAEMLEEGWAQGKEALYYRYIHNETRRLTRLIRNILDFAQLERGEFNLNPRQIYLTDFLNETLEGWRLWIEEHQFRIETDFRANPLVEVDTDTIKQVIYNLCDNAVKYARSTSNPTLSFRVVRVRNRAELTVFDNGPGISNKEEDLIFQRFYRCGNELTRETTGTGLGLSIVKEMVGKNHGTLAIHREPRQSGFGLKLSFPVLEEAEQVEGDISDLGQPAESEPVNKAW